MSTKRHILFIVFIFFSGMIHSQDTCVMAGDQTLYNYTDVIPDEVLLSCCYAPPDTFNLDLDHDGTIDFYIISWYRVFIMGDYGWSLITGAGANKVLVNSVNNDIADTLSNGDSICATGTWANKGFFIKYNHIIGDSINSYSNYEWNYLMDKFVGLAINDPIDSTFGWVQVYAACSGGPNSLTVKDYGCGYKIPTPIPVPSSSLSPPGVFSYPNPTTDVINIYLPAYTVYEIKLLNSIGQIVYQNYGSQKLIDMRAFPPAIYTLIITTSDQTFKEKVIRVKKRD